MKRFTPRFFSSVLSFALAFSLLSGTVLLRVNAMGDTIENDAAALAVSAAPETSAAPTEDAEAETPKASPTSDDLTISAVPVTVVVEQLPDASDSFGSPIWDTPDMDNGTDTAANLFNPIDEPMEVIALKAFGPDDVSLDISEALQSESQVSLPVDTTTQTANLKTNPKTGDVSVGASITFLGLAIVFTTMVILRRRRT